MSAVSLDEDMVMINMVNEHADEVRRQRQMENLFAETQKDIVHEGNSVIYHKSMNVITREISTILINFLLVLSILFLIWVTISWVNVISHNCQANASEFIWNWNFFKVFWGH
jgi:hypothetical protein